MGTVPYGEKDERIGVRVVSLRYCLPEMIIAVTCHQLTPIIYMPLCVRFVSLQ